MTVSVSIRFQLWLELHPSTKTVGWQHRSFRRGTVSFCGIVIPGSWVATRTIRKPSEQCPECEHVYHALFARCETCGR